MEILNCSNFLTTEYIFLKPNNTIYTKDDAVRLGQELEKTFYKQHGKRILDIFLALFLLFISSPILIIATLAIAVANGRPVLFSQPRVGKNEEIFTIYKFRTMGLNVKSKEIRIKSSNGVPDDFVFKNGSDNRVTKIGSFLRKTSIDELPQLLNVLKGEMSIVGPRPEVPAITNLYNDFQKQRLRVKPGITGLAQINGRSLISHGRKIEYDLTYIEQHSLLLDLKIIGMTLITVLTAKGAF